MMGRLNHDQKQFFYSFRLDEAERSNELLVIRASRIDCSSPA
jgi:hypothetical protein